jgi:predicted regulator of Ras-like GTPase activity (Roadblock/LC7/MglB family)
MTPSSDAPNRAATGFEGEVAGLGLTDIIQVNATNGFSGLIRVQHEDAAGAIFFRDGDIVHAELGEKTGEEAFFEIISWQGGRFTVQTNVFTALRTIQKSCGHLLLEAHAFHDEERKRGGGPGTSPNAPAPSPAAPAAQAASIVDLARRVPDVTNAVLLTRTGARVGGGGYETEVLGGQALFVGLLANELATSLAAGELRSAAIEGSRRHLLLFTSKTHVLGVTARQDADVGAVDAALRAALLGAR